MSLFNFRVGCWVVYVSTIVVSFFNLLLKFNGPFVISYLEYIGVADNDTTYCVLIWSRLVITTLVVFGGLIFVSLAIWRWRRDFIIIHWVRVVTFFICYPFLFYTFTSLVFSIIGIIHYDVLDMVPVSTPEFSDGSVPLVEVSDVVSSASNNLPPGYWRVRDAQYFDLLMKAEILPMSDGIVGFGNSHPDNSPVLDVPSIPEISAPSITEASSQEASTPPIGHMNFDDQFIDALADWGCKHAPRKRWIGKSYGVSTNQMTRIYKKLVRRSSDEWLKVRDKDSYIEIIRKAYDLYNREGPRTRPPKVRRRRN